MAHQFGSTARAYLGSVTHATGEDLELLALQKQWSLPIEFSSSIERMRTPPECVAAVHSVWNTAPDEVRRYFEVQSDGSFTLQKILIAAER